MPLPPCEDVHHALRPLRVAAFNVTTVQSWCHAVFARAADVVLLAETWLRAKG